MLIREKQVFLNSKTQEHVSWLLGSSTHLALTVEFAIKVSEWMEGEESCFKADVFETSDYHRWLADEKPGDRKSDWAEVQEAKSGNVLPIDLPDIDSTRIGADRDLLDQAAKNMISSFGIPRRFLERQ